MRLDEYHLEVEDEEQQFVNALVSEKQMDAREEAKGGAAEAGV